MVPLPSGEFAVPVSSDDRFFVVPRVVLDVLADSLFVVGVFAAEVLELFDFAIFTKKNFF